MSWLRSGPARLISGQGLCLAIAVLALGQQPLPERVIQSHRVPMIQWPVASPANPVARNLDFTVSYGTEDEPVAHGHDKVGRAWRVSLPAATHELWSSGEGKGRTYYFDGYTGGAGMAPGTWILALSFDEAGRPVPFYITTYDGPDAKGLRNLLQLGPADQVMLQTTWFEDQRRDIRAGYFVTRAYCRQGVYWRGCDGLHGGISFPIFERYELMPGAESKRVPPPAKPEKFIIESGNDPQSGVQTTIFHWGGKETVTQPAIGCELGAMDVVVADGPSGRQIEAGYFFPSEPGKLLPQLVRQHRPVTLTGVRRWPDTPQCVASVVWSTF